MSILKNKEPQKDDDPWVSISLKVRQSELALSNQRLKLFGYETAHQLYKDFIHSKFPVLTEDKQIDNLYQNKSGANLNTYTIGDGGKDFYQKVDLPDFYAFCLNVRKLSANTCRDTVNYFKRFRDQFFTDAGIEQIQKLSPRIRSKIMDAFRKFGLYYFYKYNNDQVMKFVNESQPLNIRLSGINLNGRTVIQVVNWLIDNQYQLIQNEYTIDYNKLLDNKQFAGESLIFRLLSRK